MARKSTAAVTVLVLNADSAHGRRAVRVIRDDRKPGDMRFEVIYQTADGGCPGPSRRRGHSRT